MTLPSPVASIGETVDGAPIGVTGSQGIAEIVVLDGGAWRTLAAVPRGELPRLSPDLARVAFQRSAPSAVIVADLRTGIAQTHDVPHVLGVAWSDTSTVLFGDLAGGEIRELDAATGEIRVRRDRPGVAMIRPLAIRDGRAVALTTTRSSKTRVLALASSVQSELPGPVEVVGWTGASELITVDLETRALTADDADGRPVRFGELPGDPFDASVAGDLLITVESVTPACALVARALVDGVARWTREVSCTTRIACAADTAAPCVVLDDDGVHRLDLADGAVGATIATLPTADRKGGALGPGGEVVVSFTERVLRLERLDGGAGREVAVPRHLRITNASYAADGRLFVVAADLGTGERGLFAVDLERSLVGHDPLWTASSAELRALRVAPDGSRAAFVEVGFQQDLVELDLAP